MRTSYKTHLVADVTPELSGKHVVLAGWVHLKRDLGRIKFLILRDSTGTIQITMRKGETSEELMELFKELTLESVVQVEGVVKRDPRAPRGVEISPTKIRVLNESKAPLPLDVSGKVPADIDTRLRERVLDLRRAEMRAVFRIMNTALDTIRRYLRSLRFVEVFTPKIIAAATEGGANLFPVVYFGREAFLAQSPQLYKELLAAAFERVFEIGPSWRAEESDTPYHLAEFIGVDIEAAFMNYHDVMKVLEGMVKEVVDEIKRRNSDDLAVLRYEPPQVRLPLKRISYREALEILEGKGVKLGFGEDIGTPELRVLSREIGEELYFLVEFPTKTRPFYTKPKDSDPEVSESFDLVWRHLELASGSSRVHDKEMLMEAMRKRGLNPKSFEFFTKWFDYGMPPHAGWGLGLSRLMLMLTGRSNVKEVTLFPRDKKRLVP
ncbi:MAG: aspartate--tRNA(Asn) ligase [Thermoprotei archaeon]|nr:MAG: aspartate--tRNA(Asn) ligase [Thermoprotei archaeon]